MDPLLTAVSTEAMKDWGPFAIVLLLLGAIAWLQRVALLAERKTSEALRAEIKELNAGRLEDARQMTRVTESSTAVAAARSQSAEIHTEVLLKMADRLEMLEARLMMSPMALPATPRARRSPR